MASTKDADGDEEGTGPNRRRRHDILKMYYGVPGEGENTNGSTADPIDINGPHFKPDMFLSKLLKERSLTELMDKETEMVRHIRSLDSDMQTLVYENYNKFISATDTIRKMKNDFRKMEDEMDHLTTNMSAITEFSSRISDTLQDRRQQITKLSGVHTLLKKLQFLFELPARLQKCIEMQAYSQAVRYYTKSRKVLHQYQDMPSFQGIQHDCTLIVQQLSSKLREQFREKDSSAKQLAECVDLLLQLNEPAEELCEEFLSHARQKIDDDLDQLEGQLKMLSGDVPDTPSDKSATELHLTPPPMDILEFIDCGCNGFLSNVCLVIASYNDMFLNRQTENEQLDAIALKKLVNFVNSVIEQYFNAVRRRVQLEKESGDNTLLVRALDRFHRRLQAMNKLLPDTDFSRAGTEIVSRAARDRVTHYLDTLKQHFSDCLTDIRQSLAAPRLVGKSEGGGSNLSDLLQNLHTSVLEQVKSVLTNLQAFIASDITFAMKPYFRGTFCSQDVREGLVVAYLRHIMSVSNDFCEGVGDKGSVPPSLLLILARLSSDFEQSTIAYLMTLAEEQFIVDDVTESTSTSQLCTEAQEMAQKLLNHYVRVQGQAISQMLRKSVETRDWLNTIEPRNVRAVMKRVVEDITAIDSQVGQLYEEGVRKERSSDSTKRSYSYSTSKPATRSNWSYTPSTLDNNLMSNIQKLFSERIEIFSVVEASKVSVLTGIIKISLKTFLECVRLRTFGRYGLQQTQVDTHYLQLYLWRFVSDENLVHFLLDEIVGSTVHRCLDPSTMEPSVSANARNVQVLHEQVEYQVENDPVGVQQTDLATFDLLATSSFLPQKQRVDEFKEGDSKLVETADLQKGSDLDTAFLKVMHWSQGESQEDLDLEDPVADLCSTISMATDMEEEANQHRSGSAMMPQPDDDVIQAGDSAREHGYLPDNVDANEQGGSLVSLLESLDQSSLHLSKTARNRIDLLANQLAPKPTQDFSWSDDVDRMLTEPMRYKEKLTWPELVNRLRSRSSSRLMDLYGTDYYLMSDSDSIHSCASDPCDDKPTYLQEVKVVYTHVRTKSAPCIVL